MRRARRNLFALAAVASAFLSAGVCVLWVLSYRPARAVPDEVPRGGWIFLNWRGQCVFARHKASPSPSPSPAQALRSLRGTWGTTTVYVSEEDGDETVSALVKALVLDPAAEWDEQTGRPITVLGRPYLAVPLAEGCRADNGGGFAARAAYLPDAGVPPQYARLWADIGPVLHVVAVPHWFAAGLTAAPAGWWLWRRGRERGRRRRGRCPGCGYDLRATPAEGGAVLAQCPECGDAAAAGSAAA